MTENSRNVFGNHRHVRFRPADTRKLLGIGNFWNSWAAQCGRDRIRHRTGADGENGARASSPAVGGRLGRRPIGDRAGRSLTAGGDARAPDHRESVRAVRRCDL